MLKQRKMVWLWIKLAPFLPAIYFSALHVRKDKFETKFTLAQTWVLQVLRILKIKVESSGQELVPHDEAILFVANHQGTIDPFVVLATMPVSTTAVSKKEAEKIPVLSTWYKTIEVILFDRESIKDAMRMIKEVSTNLLNKRNVVIFPEGTRSRGPQMQEFKPGSFKPALNSKATVVPMAMIGSYKMLDDSNSKQRKMRVVYCAPIRYDEYAQMNTTELASLAQSRIQEKLELYKEEN